MSLPTTGATQPAPSTWTEIVLASSDPAEPVLREGVDPDDVSPGLLGFLVIFVAALACIPLFWSMTSKLRKVDRRARLEAEGEPPAAADGTAGDAAPTGDAARTNDAAPVDGAEPAGDAAAADDAHRS